MVFAALKDDCADWVEKLCHSTFKVQIYSLIQHVQGTKHAHLLLKDLGWCFLPFQQSSPQLHMEENQIYASAGQSKRFL